MFTRASPFCQLPRKIVVYIILVLAKTKEKLAYDTIGSHRGYLKEFRAIIDARFLRYRNVFEWSTLCRLHRNKCLKATFSCEFRIDQGIRAVWSVRDVRCSIKGLLLSGTKRVLGNGVPFVDGDHVCLRVEFRRCHFLPTDRRFRTQQYTIEYDVNYNRVFRIVKIGKRDGAIHLDTEIIRGLK